MTAGIDSDLQADSYAFGASFGETRLRLAAVFEGMRMIVEGLVTTRNADASLNVAPMGPIVEGDFERLTLRPFATSQTYANLRREGCGVFHVVDDVLLLTRAMLNQLDPPPPTFPAERVSGAVLQQACRWFEFRVTGCDDQSERAEFSTEIVHRGRLRDMLGFNRAKHAVIEAAILVSRRHLIPPDDLQRQLEALRPPIEKTAGPQEAEAFRLLEAAAREAV